MSYYGITTDQASTLFSSLNTSSNTKNSSLSSLYQLTAGASAAKLEAKYYAKSLSQTSGASATNYKAQLQKKQEEAMEKADIKQDGLDLKVSLEALTTKGNNSILNQYSGKASDSQAIKSATIKNGTSSSVKDMELNIKQVATSQQNIGNQLKSTEKSLENGNYSFKVNVGDKTHTIDFKVESGDDNLAIQKKVAEAINSKDIGITAKANTVDGNSYLSIESKETGKTKAGNDTVFTISDTYSSTGKAVDKLGLNNITHKAQNAIYSVNNGADVESRSNKVTTSNGVQIELNKATSGNTTISFKGDDESARNLVKNFVSQFNSTLSGTSSEKAYKELTSIAKSNKYALESLGLSVDKDGAIKVNEDKFKNTSMDDIKKVFNDTGSFGTQVNKKANEIAYNPQKYVSNTSSTSGFYNSSAYLTNSSSSIIDYLF